MTRQYFKTAKQVANYLNKIAEVYGFVYETTLIQNDMKAYAGDVLEWADVMKKEKSYFNYSRTFWIRRQGVESTKQRAEYFGGIVATVEVDFYKDTKQYTVIKQNVLE